MLWVILATIDQKWLIFVPLNAEKTLLIFHLLKAFLLIVHNWIKLSVFFLRALVHWHISFISFTVLECHIAHNVTD